MPARKRAAKKTSSKKKSPATKVKRIVKPPHPFLPCIDRCYANLKTCLERNPNNAPMCMKKFTACVVGCIGPVFRP